MEGMSHLRRNLVTRPLATLALGLIATAAPARQLPPAPPSGIVVHLFGPDSITSHILPTGPEAAPASGGASTASPGGSSATASGSAASDAAQSGQTSTPANSLTWGEIGHEMFVTGDPAQEGAVALPKGKGASP
jgi:hypothetical protein